MAIIGPDGNVVGDGNNTNSCAATTENCYAYASFHQQQINAGSTYTLRLTYDWVPSSSGAPAPTLTLQLDEWSSTYIEINKSYYQ